MGLNFLWRSNLSARCVSRSVRGGILWGCPLFGVLVLQFAQRFLLLLGRTSPRSWRCLGRRKPPCSPLKRVGFAFSREEERTSSLE